MGSDGGLERHGIQGERGQLNEHTVIVEVDLPGGEDWRWFGELNVLALRRGLDDPARQAAIDEMQLWWRREHARLVPS